MRLVMMGTGLFAAPTFAAILRSGHAVVGFFTQPDREIGAERGSTRQTGPGLKELARLHGVPIFQPESVNTPDGVTSLAALAPDLLVVAAYGQILSKDILASARLGGINVHASLLPRYRGAAPIAWAILQGETTSGVTIIRMSVGLDAGDILAQEAVAIGPDETAGELETRLAELGGRLASETVARLASGPVPGTLQDKALVTKAPKLTKEQGLIDWSRSADQVCCQVRAMQPWPTAYSFLHRGQQPPYRIMLCRARAILNDGTSYSSGKVDVAAAAQGRLLVAAGSGKVEISELQPAGKRRMTGADFLHGYRPGEGDWFGA
jgi:methionyl-tRNA formyltransferase